jgi:hypothetical protein
MAGRGGRRETHHLTCPVCGAFPGTTCVDEGEELDEVHSSRRISIAERNWLSLDGWEPPELTERRTLRRDEEDARALLLNPRLGTAAAAALSRNLREGRRYRPGALAGIHRRVG